MAQETNETLFSKLPCGTTQRKKLIALQSQMDQVKKRIDEVRIQSQLLYWWDHTPPGGSLRQTQIDFYRQMPRAEGDLRLVQRLLAHMLSQFKRICDENDICGWWLQAGTLLGAIRHQGFVPWDDDLDVGIMREDLERLREVLKDHPIFEIRDYYHTKNMCGRMSKFTYRNSTIPCFIDLPVYDTMTCSNPDEGWEIIKAQRLNLKRSFVLWCHNSNALTILKPQTLQRILSYYNRPVRDIAGRAIRMKTI